MSKIVINNCYGGFSLSCRGTKALCVRKGIPCYFYGQEYPFGPKTRISDEEAFEDDYLFTVSAYQVESADLIPDQSNWHKMSLEERKASNAAYMAISVPGRKIARDDEDLIAVVEALGEQANGRCAQLKVVEIPDGIVWRIEEHDGNEWVAEVHRTWS